MLCYHRIAPVDGDPQGLAVDPQRFAGHLEVLSAEGYQVIELAELASAVARGSAPRNAVVITFDDGYANNLHSAAPLLEHREMPATFFVATEWIATGSATWWDELHFHLAAGGEDALRLASGTWPMRSASERETAYADLLRVLSRLPSVAREHELGGLRAWSGLDATPGPERRPLTPAELTELAGLAHVRIGSHTRAHPRLLTLSVADQRREIQGGVDDLATALGSCPRLFAYPFGARGRDYGRTTVELVAAAGFDAAVTTDPGPVSRLSPIHEMQRIVIGNLSAEEFAARLRRAFTL